MSDLSAAIGSLLAALAAAQTRVALVGGIAVSVRTEPRFTRDIDLAAAVSDDAAAEALIRHLSSLDWLPSLLSEQESVGRLATVRLERLDTDAEGVVCDLLLASSGIEAEVVEAADILEILPGVQAPVATVGHLIALKLLARDDETRPHDFADLRALLRVASPAELDQARSAVELIAARGFHRGRDLKSALQNIAQGPR